MKSDTVAEQSPHSVAPGSEPAQAGASGTGRVALQPDADILIAKAQRIRLQRVLMASGFYLCTLAIVLGSHLAGLLAADRALHYVIAVVLLNLFYIGMIRSGLNLRLRDPSMTMIQCVNSLWPAVYVMYFVDSSQVRGAFLLVAIVGLAFGALRLDRQRMTALAVVVFAAYTLLLSALHVGAPERLELTAEVIVALAYAMALALMVYTSSFVSSLRRSLQERNKALGAALVDLRVLATCDALTGLANRRAILEHLEKEIARAERCRQQDVRLAICLLDIDHFKRINDTFGHQAGDAALKHVAGILQESLRSGDMVGRLGGEEFLLILPATSEAAAMRIAARLCARIAASTIDGLPFGERVSASLGVAVHEQGESGAQTLGRADAALYQAKSAGRNQVVPAAGARSGADAEPSTDAGGKIAHLALRRARC